MASEISFAVPAGGKLAHQVMIAKIRDLAVLNGWTVLRFNDTSSSHEVILRGEGLTGDEEIYVGFRTYESEAADYYNILQGVFTGYVSGNSFDTQPGAYLTGLPAHNSRIDYWMACNAQRIALAMKVGTPVYESGYAGKMIPYGRPSQYPYPVVCGGAFLGAAATRFSDTAHDFYLRGSAGTRLGVRDNAGWVSPSVHPYNNQALCGVDTTFPNHQLRDTMGKYQLNPVEIYNATGMLGVLDGIYHITGFNNSTENTVTIGGVTHVVIQSAGRTGFNDYYAIRMD